jgi:hypothetical protein
MKKYKIQSIFILIFILWITISGCLGSPAFTIIFENQTNETLTIFYDNLKVGTIDPTKKIAYDHASWDRGEYQITAINLQGVTIYAKTLTHENMEKIDTMEYKVIITSSGNTNVSQHSDNFTFKE